MTDKLRDKELSDLRDDLAQTKDVLGSLITWITQSANSPLSAANAKILLKRLVRQ